MVEDSGDQGQGNKAQQGSTEKGNALIINTWTETQQRNIHNVDDEEQQDSHSRYTMQQPGKHATLSFVHDSPPKLHTTLSFFVLRRRLAPSSPVILRIPCHQLLCHPERSEGSLAAHRDPRCAQDDREADDSRDSENSIIQAAFY